jgi:hypothetical protein
MAKFAAKAASGQHLPPKCYFALSCQSRALTALDLNREGNLDPVTIEWDR